MDTTTTQVISEMAIIEGMKKRLSGIIERIGKEEDAGSKYITSQLEALETAINVGEFPTIRECKQALRNEKEYIKMLKDDSTDEEYKKYLRRYNRIITELVRELED